MTKPMNEYGSADLWIMGRQRAEAERLNRTPESVESYSRYKERQGDINGCHTRRLERYEVKWPLVGACAIGSVIWGLVGLAAAWAFG